MPRRSIWSPRQRATLFDLRTGEAHHPFENALRIERQGEIRDRSSQGNTIAWAVSTYSPSS